MRTINGIQVIESISDFLDDPEKSNAFYTDQSEKECDFINFPDRAARCYDAARNAASGSTHQEVIDDFREFGERLLRDAWNEIDKQLCLDDRWDTDPHNMEMTYAYAEKAFEECQDAFRKDCDTLEQWHHDNRTLHEQVG